MLTTAPRCSTALSPYVNFHPITLAYKGRVKFTHALLKSPGKLQPSETLAILSSPKPTTTRFYLANNRGLPEDNRPDHEEGYDCDNQLRGRKFYRHYIPQENVAPALTKEHIEKGNQNRTILDAEGKDAQFTFDIEFENLTEVELGGLLWALTLGGQAYHKLGYARPLGMGSVEITIKEQGIVLYDLCSRYQNLTSSKNQIIVNWEQLVTQFKRKVSTAWESPFEKLNPIADLLTILAKESPILPVHYPRPPQWVEGNGAFEWFVGNKSDKGPKLALPLVTEDKELPLIRKSGRQASSDTQEE